MADPVLNMRELLEGDPIGHLAQNDRNLVMARLGPLPTVQSAALTAPPGSESRGDMWILGGAGTGLWAGYSADTIAIALSAAPTTTKGWFFLAPTEGACVWILGTGHRVFNGTSWVAV